MSEDYTKADIGFKVKKAVRYIGLYGLSRTLVKIRGQYHMKDTRTFDGPKWINEACKESEASERNVAIIGCGNYAFSNIAYFLGKHTSRFLRATYDIQRTRSMSLCRAYGGAYAAGEWKEIIADPNVRVVYIASNHASHSDYAIACLNAGKHVYIEKPHVVTLDQLSGLAGAMNRDPQLKVFLGFNRPKSALFRKLQSFLEKEAGPLMINWFVAGHHIPEGHWYLQDNEGGRVLGNLCHWTDLTLSLVSMEKAFPCTIISATPIDAASDFVVSFIFADRSCASITFSAKGHTFEGVRETLNVHKGNLLANLTDFGSLTIDVVERKNKYRSLFRDHGHEANIVNCLQKIETGGPGEDPKYIAATARLFLGVREAIDSGKVIKVNLNDLGGGGQDSVGSVH